MEANISLFNNNLCYVNRISMKAFYIVYAPIGGPENRKSFCQGAGHSKESQEFQYCPVNFCIFQWKAFQSYLCLSKTEKVQKYEYVLLSIVLFHNIPNLKKKFFVALESLLERNFKLACTGILCFK